MYVFRLVYFEGQLKYNNLKSINNIFYEYKKNYYAAIFFRFFVKTLNFYDPLKKCPRH